MAARWVGWKTTAFCEIEPFCQRVLRHHWPGVPVVPDIRQLPLWAHECPICECCGERWCPTCQQHYFECQHLGPHSDELQDIGVLTAGFPCQDISNNGKREGIGGEKSGLWKECADVIDYVRPEWIVLENVAALRTRGLDTVVEDLARLGYCAAWHTFPASLVGAAHQRKRIWIVAHAEGQRVEGVWAAWERIVPSLGRALLPLREGDGVWQVEPDLLRSLHGLPRRVDTSPRIQALGNAIVPACALSVFNAIVGCN